MLMVVVVGETLVAVYIGREGGQGRNRWYCGGRDCCGNSGF